MKARIYGIKKVASEYKNIPAGFHLEIWACKTNDGYEVWTSELLTVGSWTWYKDHPEYKRIDAAVRDYRYRAVDRYPSVTEGIRVAIERVFE